MNVRDRLPAGPLPGAIPPVPNDREPSKPAEPDRPEPRESRGAWHPFTGPGIAAFGDAPSWRVSLFLGFFSLAVSGAFAWVLWSGWWPVIARAAAAFPEEAVLFSAGKMTWKDAKPGILADSPQFGIALRPDAEMPPGRTADLQLELTPNHLRLAGIAGFTDLPWPPELRISLDRREATAGWGAWRWPLLIALFAGGTLLMLGFWVLLATLHTLPLWIAGWILRRQLSLDGAWKLAAAGTLSGGTLLGLGLFGYSVRLVSWPGLAAVGAAHLPVIWLWTAWAIFSRPARVRTPAASSGPKPGNPFKKSAEEPKDQQVRTRPRRSNPFGNTRD